MRACRPGRWASAMADRRSYRIRFQTPEIPSTESIERYFSLSRESRWFSNRGPCHELLEERLITQLGGRVGVPRLPTQRLA